MIVTLSRVSNDIAISSMDITFPITVTVVIKVRLIVDVVIVGTFVCVETSYRSFTLVANMSGILVALLAQRSLLLYVSTTFRGLLDSRRRWMLLVAVLPLTGMLILYQRLLLLVTVDQGRLASKH